MKLHLILSFCLAIAALVSCQHYPATGEVDTSSTTSVNTEIDVASLVNAILSVEPIQRKVHNIISFFDLKIRLIRLAKSLLTRENFVLLRRLLDLVVSVSNFIIQFLPEPGHEDITGFNLLATLFPVTNVDQQQQQGLPDKYGPPNTTNNNTTLSVSITTATDDANTASSTTRFDRSANLTAEAQENDDGEENLDMYKDEVMQLANLIYRT